MLILICYNLIYKLLYILDPCLRILLVIGVHALYIIRGIKYILHKFFKRYVRKLTPEYLYHVYEGIKLTAALPDTGYPFGLLKGIVKGYIMLVGVALNLIDRGSAYAPSGNIDYPLYRNIIPCIIYRLKVGKDILNLLPCIEVNTSDHVIGNAA